MANQHSIPSPFHEDFLKGGPGSGNHGHAGRPGVRGGSGPGGGKISAGQFQEFLDHPVTYSPTQAERIVASDKVNVLNGGADKVGEVPSTDGMVATSQTALATIEQTADALWNHTFNTSTMDFLEHAALIDNATGKPVGSILKGEAALVSIAPHIMAMEQDRGYTQIHTHPLETSFSSGDAALFAAMPQMTRMVVRSRHFVHTLEKPAGWKEYPVNLSSSWNAFGNRLRSQFDPHSSDIMAQNDAWREHTHAIMEEVAKSYGLRYTRVKR